MRSDDRSPYDCAVVQTLNGQSVRRTDIGGRLKPGGQDLRPARPVEHERQKLCGTEPEQARQPAYPK
jgi:hypothetical protein